MEEIKVSIIIPIYNMEAYISYAIESVEQQTIDEKEVIIIDDGSVDSSYLIAKEYIKKYPNIKVIKQNNQGSGAARNAGIKIASGEYVCFLDADDFYASDDVIEYLYKNAKKGNYYICGGSSYDYIDGKIKSDGIRKERIFYKNQYIKKENYPGVAGYWAFLFQRKFLIINNIYFPAYFRGQDMPFFINAIALAGGAYCCSKKIYIYRKQHKEVVFDEKKAVGIAESYKDVLKIAIKNEMKYIQQQVYEELKGEIGAIIYKYAYQGSKKMNSIIKEYNALFVSQHWDGRLLENKKVLLEDDEIQNYILQNNIYKHKFLENLQKIERVYVFGAGVIGKKIVNFLETNYINIDSVLVSDIKQNVSKIGAAPVKSLYEINTTDDNYIVIIATFGYSQDNIKIILEKYGVTNIYPMDLCRFFLWQDQIVH